MIVVILHDHINIMLRRRSRPDLKRRLSFVPYNIESFVNQIWGIKNINDVFHHFYTWCAKYTTTIGFYLNKWMFIDAENITIGAVPFPMIKVSALWHYRWHIRVSLLRFSSNRKMFELFAYIKLTWYTQYKGLDANTG